MKHLIVTIALAAAYIKAYNPSESENSQKFATYSSGVENLKNQTICKDSELK